MRQEDGVISTYIKIAVAQLLIGVDCACHCVGEPRACLAASDGQQQTFGLSLDNNVIVLQSKGFCRRGMDKRVNAVDNEERGLGLILVSQSYSRQPSQTPRR